MSFSDFPTKTVYVVNGKSIDPEEKINSSSLSVENKEFFIGAIKEIQRIYKEVYMSDLPIRGVELTGKKITVVGKLKITSGPIEHVRWDKKTLSQETNSGYSVISPDGSNVFVHVNMPMHMQNLNKTKAGGLLKLGK